MVQVVFSVTLLLLASTRSGLPAWGGLLDGIMAFTLVATAILYTIPSALALVLPRRLLA